MNCSFVNSTRTIQRSVVDLLGWHEGVAVEMDLLGSRLLVIAVPDGDEIARRVSERLPPIVDPWLLRCQADLHPDLGGELLLGRDDLRGDLVERSEVAPLH